MKQISGNSGCSGWGIAERSIISVDQDAGAGGDNARDGRYDHDDTTRADHNTGAGISSTSIDLLLMAYIAVMIAIGTPRWINLFKMIGTMRNADGKYHDDFFVIESNDNRPSWSFFKLIYIGRSGELTPADKELIMKHEMLHGKRYHSIDMLFATLLCIVFWFNPVVWIYRRALAKSAWSSR